MTNASFYWPTILRDATNLVKKYDQYQIFILISHQPSTEMITLVSLWLFFLDEG